MQHSQVAAIELITSISYLMILIGFGVRNLIERGNARLLWPWLLVSIFGLCGITRLDYVGVFRAGDLIFVGMHLALAASSLAYGVGQLIYACWPELFEDEPRLTRSEPQIKPAASAEPAPAEAEIDSFGSPAAGSN